MNDILNKKIKITNVKVNNNMYWGESTLWKEFTFPFKTLEKKYIFFKNFLSAQHFVIDKKENPTSSRDPYQVRRKLCNAFHWLIYDIIKVSHHEWSDLKESELLKGNVESDEYKTFIKLMNNAIAETIVDLLCNNTDPNEGLLNPPPIQNVLLFDDSKTPDQQKKQLKSFEKFIKNFVVDYLNAKPLTMLFIDLTILINSLFEYLVKHYDLQIAIKKLKSAQPIYNKIENIVKFFKDERLAENRLIILNEKDKL